MKMVGRVRRVLAPASMTFFKSHQPGNLFAHPFSLISLSLPRSSPRKFHSHFISLVDVICKALAQQRACGPGFAIRGLSVIGCLWIHSGPSLNDDNKVVDAPKDLGNNASVGGVSDAKVKRKKLKGKRAVVRWLKFFRWKKKKEYQRMTAEEKILYKLNKARKKEERLVHALKKIEPKESSETTHDPEILTPEEHFFFLKMGLKCKNYVPVGRRGIYQGVILNMHLHWKKHQTLQVVVKTFTPDEVKDIAAELAQLTGGIVLDIHEENKIIMYRGKNYSQPPTEIMSPRVTLSRKKALDKSKYLDGLRNVRKYIPRLEEELKLLHARAQNKSESSTDAVEGTAKTVIGCAESQRISNMSIDNSRKLTEYIDRNRECSESSSEPEMSSDTEDLSDIFETDSETDTEDTEKRPLYLDQFEKFPVDNGGEPDDFEEHLRQISLESKTARNLEKDSGSPTFDEVDLMFLRAASLLKKKKR